MSKDSNWTTLYPTECIKDYDYMIVPATGGNGWIGIHLNHIKEIEPVLIENGYRKCFINKGYQLYDHPERDEKYWELFEEHRFNAFSIVKYDIYNDKVE